MAQVVRSKDASSLLLPSILANLANASMWTTYGLASLDANLVIPNGSETIVLISISFQTLRI